MGILRVIAEHGEIADNRWIVASLTFHKPFQASRLVDGVYLPAEGHTEFRNRWGADGQWVQWGHPLVIIEHGHS